MRVVLHINGFDPVVVEHDNVSSVRTVGQVAKEAINELNLVCMHNDKDAYDRTVRERRQRYRGALGPIAAHEALFEKLYDVGTIELARRNRYTHASSFRLQSSDAVLGAPEPGVELSLHVEARPQ